VEYYKNGMRHGPLRVHYQEGQLKREADYQYGKLMTSREYYIDGTLRMEEDYGDAREYKDGRETGIGKVYSREGVIKYEWYFVNSDPVAYRKSYDRNSRLTAELYYDQDGNLVQPKAEIITNNVPAGAN
jgi:antitoxin component YwqK of YwqJK toxin-antitoxin module